MHSSKPITSRKSACGSNSVKRRKLWRLKGADDFEIVIDEDVVRPVDADIVNLIFAVTQLHNTVDNASR